MKSLTRKNVHVSNLVGYRGGAENASSSENSANLPNDEEESAKDGRLSGSEIVYLQCIQDICGADRKRQKPT
jgi:hypothetical protein